MVRYSCRMISGSTKLRRATLKRRRWWSIQSAGRSCSCAFTCGSLSDDDDVGAGGDVELRAAALTDDIAQPARVGEEARQRDLAARTVEPDLQRLHQNAAHA